MKFLIGLLLICNTALASSGSVNLGGTVSSSVSSGGSSLTTPISIANGGTNNASLSVADGTVYYGSSSKLLGLAPGSNGKYLKLAGGVPTWASAASTPQAASVFVSSPWTPASQATALPFTSANAVAGASWTTSLIGTNLFTAAHTGIHGINVIAFSTGFTGAVLCQLFYQVNSGAKVQFTQNLIQDQRCDPNGTAIIHLTAGDTVQLYGNVSAGTTFFDITFTFYEIAIP